MARDTQLVRELETLAAVAPDSAHFTDARPQVGGKFLFAGGAKLWVRGVTYGTFRPDEDGNEYHDPPTVERDFALIAAYGFNAVRTYTVPPRWLLDIAQRHALRVMVGLPWEQHVAFLDDAETPRAIEQRVRGGVRACARHPAVLCYAVGNEIPAPMVRWHGRRRVSQFLYRLYEAAKAEDPDGLVTYVNYPSTEYLELPFLDFVCANVFLEARDRLEAYLMRLQNIAGDRPLVMGEIGLDSLRHGEGRQAEVLDWHIRTVFANGCAGAFVFAWTDEWHRGGHDIEGWRFGLTDRDRRPKPALAAVQRALRDIPFPSQLRWPRISVIVCSRNGARTIRECFDGLRRLEYPDFEVIVVDDGSTDETPAIAHEYGFVLIKTDHCGLSAARNAGLDAATGEIVAYIDDDAYPDPHWLTYLAAAFMRTAYEGIGGPNLALPDDGPIAQSVARAPGGPIHVLLSDHEAEHIPGCNMAFRRPCLQVVGGFDPQFRTAGDDVDLCWRLQQRGWKLGFCPAALVWHHRRNSVRAYWKQQRGYGKAEALLERKWPEKYNSGGHLSWAGRVYGPGCSARLWSRERVYHGTWGGALFQSLYQPGPSLPESLPAMPEWYLVIAALAIVSGLGVLWSPLFVAIPLLAGAILVLLVHAAVAAARSPGLRLDQRAITAFLHLLQPAARLTGRLRNGLTPWRRRGIRELVVPWPRTVGLWSERWRPHDEWLYALERLLRNHRVVLRRGGEFDRWDLEARDGTLGAVRLRMAVEEHGAGRQLARFFVWPTVPRCVCVLAALLTALAAGGAAAHAWGAEFILGAAALAVGLRMCRDCAAAAAAAYRALTAGVPDAQVVAVSPSAGIRWDRTP